MIIVYRKINITKIEPDRPSETEGERKLRENIEKNKRKKEAKERERQKRNERVKYEYIKKRE